MKECESPVQFKTVVAVVIMGVAAFDFCNRSIFIVLAVAYTWGGDGAAELCHCVSFLSVMKSLFDSHLVENFVPFDECHLASDRKFILKI
jgi:hypothetical protein